jgi:hypothetical protein
MNLSQRDKPRFAGDDPVLILADFDDLALFNDDFTALVFEGGFGVGDRIL